MNKYTNKKNPTVEFYSLFQFIYEDLNKNLFNGKLPDCMFVITRKKGTFGYYIPQRWVNEDFKSDELAINPQYFARYPLIEMLQTIAHEMCHVWQYHLGKPTRTGYHNKEFASKMENIGLMASDTGLPGGKMTGQKMGDYPIKDGIFLKVVNELAYKTEMKNLWVDTYSLPYQKLEALQNIFKDIDQILLRPNNAETIEVKSTPSNQRKAKIKYTCPNCRINLWGKGGLNVLCGKCDCNLEEDCGKQEI